MVSSSTISSDAGKIKDIFKDYESNISTLDSGIWEGNSKENAVSQMKNFISQFEGTINNQMSNFELSVSKYNEYKEAKQDKEQAENNRRREIENARAMNRPANTSSYDYEINRCSEKMHTLKSEITELLTDVKKNKLDIEVKPIDPGTFTLGDFINYFQGDYSNVRYGSGSIASCGCGPTAMAMVLTYLTGENVKPPETASFAARNGHYVWGAGTAWSFFASIAKKYGIGCEKSGPNTNKLINDLKNGKIMIMSMGPGHFTKNGHFIVLRGITSDGKIIVADPNSRERSKQVWDVGTIIRESRQMWSFVGDNLKEFVI